MLVVPFSKTEINRSDIDQSLLDIDQRSRTSLFAWNGQFSPQFIEALLEKYADSSSVVYDPFAGSGTVLTESARKGLSAYGVELNPAAYYMAKCNELCMLSSEERQAVIDAVGTSLASSLSYDNQEEALSEWYASFEPGKHKDLAALLIGVPANPHPVVPAANPGLHVIQGKNKPQPPQVLLHVLGHPVLVQAIHAHADTSVNHADVHGEVSSIVTTSPVP